MNIVRAVSCTAVLGIAAFSALAQAAGPAPERATALLLGQPVGYQELRVRPDGSLAAHFEFNDRGRGPKIDARYRLAPDGTLRSSDTTGVNYLKAKVDEHFALAKGQAQWRSTNENAQRAFTTPAFYLSIDGAPAEFAMLVQALLKAPGQHLALLPTGEAQLQQVTKTTVSGKAGSQALTLVAITGIDLTPDYLWLDDKNRFFASYSSWFSVVREGWEDTIPALGKLQDAQSEKLASARAATLTTHVDTLAIEHVRVFDPDRLAAKAAQTVLVHAGRIAAVGNDGELSIAPGAQRLDGRGRFLMAGLWDMHVHMSPNDGALDIAAGITTVRDLGNDSDFLAGLEGKIESGADIGPRIIKAGLIDGRGPYQGPTKVYADTPEEAVQAVNRYADLGYPAIKIYSSVKPELVPALVKQARARGMRVSGHVPAFMTAAQFAAAGVDEIQHINFVFLNFLFDQVKDTRTPARFSAVAQHGAELDLSSPAVTEFVSALKKGNVAVDPTLVTFENMFLERPGLMGPSGASVVDRLPLVYQRYARAGGGGLEVPPGMDARYRESYARMVQMVGLLYRSGVTVVAGTDGFDALSLPREFELYVNAGIPPAEVLRLDTLGAARLMKRDDAYGRVAPGYVADLVLVDGDPLLNISDMRKVRSVLRGDRLYDSAAVFQAMGIQPAP